MLLLSLLVPRVKQRTAILSSRLAAPLRAAYNALQGAALICHGWARRRRQCCAYMLLHCPSVPRTQECGGGTCIGSSIAGTSAVRSVGGRHLPTAISRRRSEPYRPFNQCGRSRQEAISRCCLMLHKVIRVSGHVPTYSGSSVAFVSQHAA